MKTFKVYYLLYNKIRCKLIYAASANEARRIVPHIVIDVFEVNEVKAVIG